MTKEPKKVYCTRCGSKMAYYCSNLSTNYDTLASSAKWEYTVVCPFCNELTCIIEGCDRPAATVYEHTFIANRAASNVRNDIWICKYHTPTIERFRKLHSQEFLGCLISVASFITLLILISKTHPLLCFGIASALFLLTAALKLRAKEYSEKNFLVKKEAFSIRGRDPNFD